MIDQAIIDHAGEALDALFAEMEREHPDLELLVRSNSDRSVFRFRGDDQVELGTCSVFVNLMGGRTAFKAYSGTTAEGLASVIVRADAAKSRRMQ